MDGLLTSGNFAAFTFEDGRQSYLKRHFFDEEKLRARAREEFIRAARTGRLIAFTGAMTSEARGYVSWNEFADHCFTEALDIIDQYAACGGNRAELRKLRAILEDFRDATKDISRRPPLDVRVGFSVIGEVLDLASHYRGTADVFPNANMALADKLFLDIEVNRPSVVPDILDSLIRGLGIDRFLTLNYDFELELACMRAGSDKLDVGKIAARRALGKDLITDPKTMKMMKALPGGQSMVSDLFFRERTDRLIEFAVGSADHDYHVLHLHGRADSFASMVVSYRDYDRMYRRGGPTKAPFEHALKILYAGNPILFVGMGMGEEEVNRTLREFVGNHPYRRITPTFLLWTAPRTNGVINEAAKRVMRVDFLHRLGVLTLFDDEVASKSGEAPLAPDASKLDRLRRHARDMATLLLDAERERLRPIVHWRSVTGRLAGPAPWFVQTWRIVDHRMNTDCPDLLDGIEPRERLTLVVGRSGLGKNSMAQKLARRWYDTNAADNGSVLLLNADFCFDTDSLLTFLSEFLWQGSTAKAKGEPRPIVSRASQFSQTGAFTMSTGPALVVISGVERLFGTNGEPLSAEFDQMIRAYLRAEAESGKAAKRFTRMMILGTARIRPYFECLLGSSPGKAQSETFQIDEKDPRSFYMDWISSVARSKLKRTQLPVAANLKLHQKTESAAELPVIRRAFFASYLDPQVLKQCGISYPDLALDILTVMAFVGQPVEDAVLIHAPRLQRRLAEFRKFTRTARVAAFRDTLNQLLEVGLVVEIDPFNGWEMMQRFGIHTTLLAELRDRCGVPLSEASLSTAFNMSLHAAQPTDGPLPKPFLHDELGELIDWLVGAFKDRPLHPALGKKGERGRPDALAALRAALTVVRGFYSTTALLSLDCKDRHISPDRDGALTEHAERLERLIAAFGAGERRAGNGPGPLYPDELVWLHNERGVVKLAQGDLYEARFSFNEAERINRIYVEYEDNDHNWRRITLNQIIVDIERAKIDSAENRIIRIERQIGRETITNIVKFVEESPHGALSTHPYLEHEQILVVALLFGYRGICAHVRGKLVDSSEYFCRAIAILRALGERRAYAIFQRHYSALGPELLGIATATELDLAISAAESVHQMDIVHLGRIQRARQLLAQNSPALWPEANRLLMDAVEYADVTDMYRIRAEAQANLAQVKMVAGDSEVALEHAADAMAVASRYGLSLRKISLRILLGRILIRRGDPDSGNALIEAAKSAATRVGYQRVIAAAQGTSGR